MRAFPIQKYFEISRQFLKEGHPRSILIKKQIVTSFVIKGLSILIGFVLVPITLGFLNQETYGIWLTLSSIIAWFQLFDIGLGYGLRNKLAEALAKEDFKEAKILVSSTYAIIGLISIGIFLIFLILNPLLNWPVILNITPDKIPELSLVIFITFSFFCLSFILKLLHSIFLADQKPAIPGLLDLFANLISLVCIIILSKALSGSLLFISLVMGLAPVIVLGAASLYFFKAKYQSIAPAFKYVRKEHFYKVTSLGFQFFLVGITGLIIFSTDNLIIVQLFGPAEVPSYQIAYKYFGLVTSIFSIISVPFWSAYTEAQTKNDTNWITGTNKKLRQIWTGLLILSVLMLVLSRWFYSIWVPEIPVPFLLSLMMCIYVLALSWGNIFVMYINGVGKVKLQVVISLIGAILNIPLSVFFADTLNMGTAGIILASTICIGYGPLVAPSQYRKLITHTAKGIWNK